MNSGLYFLVLPRLLEFFFSANDRSAVGWGRVARIGPLTRASALDRMPGEGRRYKSYHPYCLIERLGS